MSSFGYNMLGFGSFPNRGPKFYEATGGTVTTDGNYKVNSFTSSGTFSVSVVPVDPSSAELDYLIIAGGGSGGNNSGCGGGAGGRLYLENYTGITSTGDITVTVGAGGAAKTSYGRGYNGADSVFNSITATGGGAGGGWTSASSHQAGSNGGSGGGSGNNATPGQGIDGQGNDGGTASGYSMGAGGGAGSAASGTSRGEGVADSITGSSVTRARGAEQGDGAGAANTGNGGFRETAGGSGIVIIRYKFQ